MFSGLKEEGYLIEASLSIEERILQRNTGLTYWYGVKRRQNVIEEFAGRLILIPLSRAIKGKMCKPAIACHHPLGFCILYINWSYNCVLEMHLYEGLISPKEGFWKTGLQKVGAKKSKGEEISDTWQASARHLLNRIFQKWSPADKKSTDSFCDSLGNFISSLGSAHARTTFQDNSHPPRVTVGETRAAELNANIYDVC